MERFNFGPFFTLSELVRAWTEQDADQDTLANRRRVVRRNTVGSQCPHIRVGAETVFLTESFLLWLKEHEEVTSHESA